MLIRVAGMGRHNVCLKTILVTDVGSRFDQDLNPHNDCQAHDRAYCIGQKQDVEVVKLLSRDTICCSMDR